MLLVEPETRAFVASELPKDAEGGGHPGLYVGVLPADQLVANTSMHWRGTTWAQLRAPLPEDPAQRRVLLAHESFHRVQEGLGLTGKEGGNAHLDSLEGRVLLQLEWRALARALGTQGAARREAAQDALLFRTARRARFPQATEEERGLERHEGLAEYTGVRLGGTTAAQRHALALRDLEQTAQRPSFVRAFAYASGPAYGLLLDEAGAQWRPHMREGADLGELLRSALKLQVPSTQEVAARENAYDGAALRRTEEARAAEAAKQLAHYRSVLVEGPVLHLPLRKMNIEFNPATLVPLDAEGTVYPTAHIVDVWGALTVTGGGVRMASDWKHAYVAAPRSTAGDTLSGEGWTLKLSPGWSAQPGARKGDLELRESAGR
ncbi:hypothetical protein FGE12_05350 [Aggregicoccus sp. 17bor-14]|nr:hypothetical protein [Simulacricoccus sp. 17bor-14]MRI87588.1 hypothetical protein [Aggregicoccus sp. 17bor-14]